MIYQIYSNNKQFKPVKFKLGLNIIKADKKPDSRKKDSRNGLGKTTLINIIHFCLGSTLDKKLLPVDDIKDWVFFIEMDLSGKKITASRSIEKPGIIKIKNGDISSFPIKAEKSSEEDCFSYKINDWKSLLGISLFGIQSSSRGIYKPSFRTLIAYFIRRGTGAFSSPFSCFRAQPSWSYQVHNAFLLGLNWELASQVQDLKDEKNSLKSLRSAITNKTMPSQGELESERVSIESEVTTEKKSLSNFNVHPQYKEIQEKVDLLTNELHSHVNSDITLRRQLKRYQRSVELEHAPDNSMVETLYKEAGICFEGKLKRTLEEAKEFHSTVVKNRKQFLEMEISEIKHKITTNDSALKNKTEDRSSHMKVLQSHGALDEFILLKERFIKKQSALEAIKSKISYIKKLSSTQKENKACSIDLETKLQLGYEESKPEWEKLIESFNKNSHALYNKQGNLIINVSDTGYKFDVNFFKSSSEGVGKMKIFCYDLMLVEKFAKNKQINFLVHDSTIFGGVDSRQTSLALTLAHKTAIDNNFQYICAFNSDMIPSDFKDDLYIDDFVRLKLHDNNPQGTLMGFHFNKKDAGL